MLTTLTLHPCAPVQKGHSWSTVQLSVSSSLKEASLKEESWQVFSFSRVQKLFGKFSWTAGGYSLSLPLIISVLVQQTCNKHRFLTNYNDNITIPRLLQSSNHWSFGFFLCQTEDLQGPSRSFGDVTREIGPVASASAECLWRILVLTLNGHMQK